MHEPTASLSTGGLVALMCALLAACGGASPSSPTTAEPAAPITSPPSGAPMESSAEVTALLRDVLVPAMCPKLLGSFIGLPGEGDARGPAAGTLPSVGRWWIRRCETNIEGPRLALRLGGAGWTWVDRESRGFRVRQYVLFEADVALSANVAIGYDEARQVVSLWMRPEGGVVATVEPRGVVSAEATGFFSSVIGGALAIAGDSVSDRARAEAQEIGSAQMRERLANGFTMTFVLDSRQMDFMVGALDRGQVPERPYATDHGTPWIVNQRSMVWPGGLDVIGPLSFEDGGDQLLDVVLEEGSAAVIRSVCVEPMTRYLDARYRMPPTTAPPPGGQDLVSLVEGAERSVRIPRADCETLLVVVPDARATLPIKLRYRVSHASVAATATGATTPSAPPPAAPRRARIRILGLTVSSQNPAGHDWDLVGGDADLYVVTASIPLGREVDRTPTARDSSTATFDRWLPGAYEMGVDMPLRFTVYDADTTTDEVVGTADFDASHIPRASGDVSLSVRSLEAVPTQTGSLRLRVEPLP